MSRRFIAVLALVAVAAFAGRAAYILAVTEDRTLAVDETYYFGAAARVADGDWFKTPPLFGLPDAENAEHPPFTALVLAPVALVSGDSSVAMRFAVALAGVAAVVVMGLIGRRVVGERAGLIAAAIAAVYPNLWMNDGILMSETFATLTTAVAVLFALRAIKEPSWPNVMGIGAACGLAMLSRAELALLVPLLVVPVMFAAGPEWRRRWMVAGVAVATASILVVPWITYNLARFEEPVLLSHGDGGVLEGANCTLTYEGEQLGFWSGFCYPFSEPGTGQDRSVASADARDRAFDHARDNLSRVPVVMAARVGRVWDVYRPFQMVDTAEAEGRPRWASWLGLAMYWLLVPLAFGGAIALRRRRRQLFVLLTPVIVVTVVAAATYGLPRFRAPAEVSVVVLAAVAVDALLRPKLPTRRRAQVSEGSSS